MEDDLNRRLGKVEGELQGVMHGQRSLREHLDHQVDGLKELMNSIARQPATVPLWVLLLIAAPNMLIALALLFIALDLLLFQP